MASRDMHMGKARVLAARFAAAVSELVSPTRCVGCDALGSLLCPSCERSLPFVDRKEACPRCGAPGGRLVCTECQHVLEQGGFPFSAARCAGSFDGVFARLVTTYKDGGERDLAPVLARLLAIAAGQDWRMWADAVTFVPARPEAYRRRGFDHMELVASHLASRLRLPLADVLVCGRRRDQRGLSAVGRAANMRDAFSPVEEACEQVRGQRLLLADDVFTTGSTLAAATEVLLAAGAREVRVIVLCRVW